MAKAQDLSLREFQHAVARLRKLGLVQKRSSVEIARRLPDVKSPQLLRAVNKYKDVLSGVAGVVKRKDIDLSKNEARKRGLRRSNDVGTKDVILVPKFKDEKVSAQNRSILYTSPEGTRIQRLELPAKIDTSSKQAFIKSLKKINIDKLPPDSQLGIRFFNGRTALFSPSQLKYMLGKISAYETFEGAHGRKQTNELIRNIEIIVLPKTKAASNEWHTQKEAARKKKK